MQLPCFLATITFDIATITFKLDITSNITLNQNVVYTIRFIQYILLQPQLKSYYQNSTELSVVG